MKRKARKRRPVVADRRLRARNGRCRRNPDRRRTEFGPDQVRRRVRSAPRPSSPPEPTRPWRTPRTSGIVISGPIPIIVMTLTASAPRNPTPRIMQPLVANRKRRIPPRHSTNVVTSELARLLGLTGDLHVDFVDSPALAGNPPATRRNARDRLHAAGLRSGGPKRYPVHVRAARLHRRAVRIGRHAPVGDERRAVDRPVDRRGAMRAVDHGDRRRLHAPGRIAVHRFDTQRRLRDLHRARRRRPRRGTLRTIAREGGRACSGSRRAASARCI